jgi:molybdenum cofactor biosynthesis protein B
VSVEEHKKGAPTTIRCKIITVSDTRKVESDKSGGLIKQLLQEKGFPITEYDIVKDEQEEIMSSILRGCEDQDIDAIMLNGGTGIAKRDVTIEVVQSLIDKEMIGFGEIFRMLSYTEDIGSAAILSRAVAGIRDNTAIFSMPGSSGAVRLAMNKLVIPELGHVIRELRK